jgi:ABC-type molybdate transport system substrate-binding protein
MKNSKNIEAARKFVQFLKSAQGAAVLQQFGFSAR